MKIPQIIPALVAFASTTAIGIGTYRYLWTAVDPVTFVSWFAILDMAQLFLLLDLGFSHRFIREYKSYGEKALQELAKLRGALLATAFFIAALTFVFGIIAFHTINQTTVISVTCLALSVFLSVFAYAETAILRARNKNTTCYLLQAASNIVFLAAFVVLDSSPLLKVSSAALARSAFFYVSQLSLSETPWIIKRTKFRPELSVITLNLAYYLLFIVDLYILRALNYNPEHLATLALYKKYFDVGRTFVDYCLPMLFARMTAEPDSVSKGNLFALSIGYYLILAISAGPIVDVWIENARFNSALVCTLAISTLTITMFRTFSLTRYFGGHQISARTAVAAALSKLCFFASAILLPVSEPITLAYLLQSLAISVVTLKLAGTPRN